MRIAIVLLVLLPACRSRSAAPGDSGLEVSRAVVPDEGATARTEVGSAAPEPAASATERQVVEEAPIVVPLWIRVPGLTAREVEQQVAVPLERALGSLPGVREVRVRVQADGGEVEVLADRGTEIGPLRADLLARAGSLQQRFGPATEIRLGPERGSPRFDVHYTLFAPGGTTATLSVLHEEAVRRPLLGHPGVADARACGRQIQAVHVLLDVERLAALGGTPAQVWSMIAGAATRGDLVSMEALAGLPVAAGEAGSLPLREVAQVKAASRPIPCATARCGAGSLEGCIRLGPPEPQGKPVRSIQADVARRLAELDLPAGVSVSVDPPDGAGPTDRVVLMVAGPDRPACRSAAAVLATRLAATREVVAVVGPAPLESTVSVELDPDTANEVPVDPTFLEASLGLVGGTPIGTVAFDGDAVLPLRVFAGDDGAGVPAAVERLRRLATTLPDGVNLPIRVQSVNRPRQLLRLNGQPAEAIGLRLATRVTEVPAAIVEAAMGVSLPPGTVLDWRLGELSP